MELVVFEATIISKQDGASRSLGVVCLNFSSAQFSLFEFPLCFAPFSASLEIKGEVLRENITK